MAKTQSTSPRTGAQRTSPRTGTQRTSPGTGAQPGSSSPTAASVDQARSGQFGNGASGQDNRGVTVPIPSAGEILSTAATAMMTPIAIARRILPAKGGLPVYAGLGGLALVGIVEWPVAVAAGAGYGLARLVRPGTDQPAQGQRTAPRNGLSRDDTPGPG